VEEKRESNRGEKLERRGSRGEKREKRENTREEKREKRENTREEKREKRENTREEKREKRENIREEKREKRETTREEKKEKRPKVKDDPKIIARNNLRKSAPGNMRAALLSLDKKEKSKNKIDRPVSSSSSFPILEVHKDFTRNLQAELQKALTLRKSHHPASSSSSPSTQAPTRSATSDNLAPFSSLFISHPFAFRSTPPPLPPPPPPYEIISSSSRSTPQDGPEGFPTMLSRGAEAGEMRVERNTKGSRNMVPCLLAHS